MKKAAKWIAAGSAAVFVIDWSAVGLSLLVGNYDVIVGAYIGLVSLVTFFLCALYLRFMTRCPHCGKVKQTFGEYCPCCGKKFNG